METKNRSHIVYILLLLVFSVGSCKKDETAGEGLSRLFMPGGRIQIVEAENFVTLSWQVPLFTQGPEDELAYTVEVSRDSTFQGGIDFQAVTDTTGITITDEHIEVRQKYFARTKTNGKGNSADSKWLISPAFLIPGMQSPTPE